MILDRPRLRRHGGRNNANDGGDSHDLQDGWRSQAIYIALPEVLVREAPVDELPELFDVLGARVSIVDVTGVLPHVEREDARLARRERRVGVRGRLDRESAVGGLDEPRP